MILGKVIGEVWGTRKHARLEGRKALLVAVLRSSGEAVSPDSNEPDPVALDSQYPGPDGLAESDQVLAPSGEVVVALDTIGARVGNTVTVAWGSGARAVFKGPENRDILADAAIARIVDGQSHDNS